MARGGINKALVQKARQAILTRARTPASTRYGSNWAIPARKPPFIAT